MSHLWDIPIVQQARFHPKALEEIRSFPKSARHDLGEAILDLQTGQRLTMPLSKAMPGVGRGVHELRVRDSTGAYRAFYVLISTRGVIVFHAFEKRTQKTPQREIELGRKRLREML
jgi:phage-related protein